MGGPDFRRQVVPGGYLWWYLDALSDDGRHGLTVIAFVGSVFSPYYAWAGRRAPDNHVCLNVALYGPRARWAMTERGRGALTRDAASLCIGPSALHWRDGALCVEVDERAAPLPRRLRGRIRLIPQAVTGRDFALDPAGRHRWWPIAPLCRVEVEMRAPALAWAGRGYLDANAGEEPLEAGFRFWTWARATHAEGALLAYDALRRDGTRASLGLEVDRDGRLGDIALPPAVELRRGLWGVRRPVRGGLADGRAEGAPEDGTDSGLRLRRGLEDAPFYTRSQLAGRLCGREVEVVHESLDLDRFASPLVKLMLPFRMPRRP